MTTTQALYLIKTVDSRHQAIQPVLRKFVRGEKVSDEELDQLPSTFAPAVKILKDVRDNKVDETTIEVRDELDTFSEPLKPLLAALIEGLED